MPDHRRPRSYRAKWVGGLVGFCLGIITTPLLQHGLELGPIMLGRAFGWGVIGFLVGYAIDRRNGRFDRLQLH